MHATHNIDRIDLFGCGAESGDLIGKGDQRRKYGIRCVLDHLRRLGISQEAWHGRIKARVQQLENLVRAGVNAAEHQPVGVGEILDRRPFGEELGIHAESEIHSGELARRLFQVRAHRPRRRAWNHRALHDHGMAAGQRF